MPYFGTVAPYLCGTKQQEINQNAMKNTDFTIDSLSSLLSSESSYLFLVDMIKDLDLELLDVTHA